MGTTLKFLSENTVRKCTFGKPEDADAIIGTKNYLQRLNFSRSITRKDVPNPGKTKKQKKVTNDGKPSTRHGPCSFMAYDASKDNDFQGRSRDDILNPHQRIRGFNAPPRAGSPDNLPKGPFNGQKGRNETNLNHELKTRFPHCRVWRSLTPQERAEAALLSKRKRIGIRAAALAILAHAAFTNLHQERTNKNVHSNAD